MRRFGVARVKNEPGAVLLVSGLSDADTLTTNKSTRATRSYGNGASVSSVLVVPPFGTSVALLLHEPAAINSAPNNGRARKVIAGNPLKEKFAFEFTLTSLSLHHPIQNL